MNFYEVWVRSNHYHGTNGLTYYSNEKLSPGQLVRIPLRHESVAGIVIKPVSKPRIEIKPIETVLELPPLPQASLKLMHWLAAYYPSPVGTITQLFLPQGISGRAIVSLDTNNKADTKLPPLTQEQQDAYKTISRSDDTYLVHGRTGSGKTRLYLELAKDSIAKGRSVILLTPEISLTTQLENSLKRSFNDQVVVLHSTLTPKQRAERWTYILTAEKPLLVIGPRSAVFSPLASVGLIIMDEEHEPAYKQEQAPYYQTVRVASQLRKIHDAKLLLGSATPLISDYYMATTLKKPVVRLKSLAQSDTNKQLTTTVIDRKDYSLFNRSSYLSQPLIEAIESALANRQQSLLYLNRRGTARVIICETCDWQAECPRCDLPLTYHADKHILRCHTCGYSSSAPVSCPKCSNPTVKYLSIGTKAVVDEVTRLFPNARIQRFDADNAKAERIEQQFESVKNGDVDIIVGTQMLAKGLDLPKLSVVGVLLADTSLQLPDFTANERTYELLQQVVGRVGRGHVKGHAVIQTYQPENKTISAALDDNWDKFYNNEIKERERYQFPPFVHLLKLTVQRASAKSAEQAAKQLITKLDDSLIVEGPAPAFHEKLNSKYRWQLIVKSKERSKLLKVISELPSGWSYDIDPSDLM